MSIFGTLTIGKQGLIAHQKAIQTTSNNIANVNTPGYSRQRPVFEPVTASPLPDGLPAGGGVQLQRVERVADEFLDSQLRREQQELTQQQKLGDGLSRLEAIFQELDGSGIDAALSRLFGAFNDLANDPGNSTVRATVVQGGAALASFINDTDRRLAQVAVDENAKVEQLAREVSQISGELAVLNDRIFRDEVTGEASASLRDRRGELLLQLSKKIDVTSFERADGTVAVFVAGGFLLVDGSESASLQVQTGAGTGGAFFDVYQNLGGSQAGPITSRISGGELGAAIALRDERVTFYRAKLDEFAYTLGTRVNAVHMAGRGTQDDNARRFFVERTGTPSVAGADFSAISGSAGLISVHSALLSDFSNVAAGTPASGASAAGDNRNALALAAIESASAAVYQLTTAPADVAGGAASGPSRTVGDMYGAVLGELGAEIQSTERRSTQADLILAELQNRRGALSGVSIDEEVADLIRFEKAYQASARVLSMVDRMLDQLLAI